jgi:hypothetical protein
MPKPPRAWQRMLSGRRLDLLDPTPVDIEIEDIAHGLAFVARWNGQTKGDFAYSVAEHSLLVERSLAASRRRAREMAAGRAAARRPGIRDRRHDLAGEGRRGAGLRRARRAAVGGDPPALRPAGRAPEDGQGADQAGRQGVGLAGSGRRSRVHRGRGDRFFGQARGAVRGLHIRLRPPRGARSLHRPACRALEQT